MKPFDPVLLRRVPAARAPVALLSATGVVGGAVAVAQAVVLAWLASTVVSGGQLTAPLAWTVGLLLARGVIAGGQESVAGWAGTRVAAGLRTQVLGRWSQCPEGERPEPEEAVQRATDGIASVEPYVARYLPALLAAAVVPALTVVTLLVVDVWSALIVVVTLPLLPVFAALIGQHTQDETRRRWEAMTELAGHFLDVVRGLPTLVAYGRAHRQVDVVAEVGRRHQRATIRTLRTAFLSTVALELLATISVALVAVCVGLRLAFGAMDLQVAMTAILLAPEAYWPIRRVGSEFHNAADGAEALDRLLPDLTLTLTPPPPSTERTGARFSTPPGAPATRVPTPPSAPATRASTPPSARDRALSIPPGAPAANVVRVEHLTYAHPGRHDILHGLCLQTEPGPGLTVVTGPSGAGKTTLLELIAGLRVPTDGTVEAPAAQLATQRPLLLPGSVRDNLALAGSDASDGEMVMALSRVGLWPDLAERDGLDTALGDDGFGLSAGQRGRLAIARAAISGAPLVLLDEPTAHIAPDSLSALRQVIVELAQHRRVIVATHDLDLAALADQRWQVPLIPATSDSQLDVGGGPVRTPALGRVQTDPPHALGGVGTARSHALGGVETRATGALGGEGTAGSHAPSRARRGGLPLAAMLGGLATASGVALTATSGWLIVQASYQPVVLTLMVAIVGVRTFGLARPVLRYAERVTSHDVALADLARARTHAYQQLIPLTPARLGRRSRADVLTGVVRDLDDITDEQVRVIVPAWDTVIASLVAALVVGAFLPPAALIIAGSAVLSLLLGRLVQHLESPWHQRLVAARGRVRGTTTLVTSQLTQVQAVTGLGGAAILVNRVKSAQATETDAARALSRTRGAFIAATWAVIAAAVGAVAWLAGAAYLAGTLSGPVAALVALTPMALAEAWASLPEVFGARARSHAARARLTALLAQTPAVAQAENADETDHTTSQNEPHPWLNTTGLGVRWDSDGAQITPPDLHVEPGQRIVLTGPNGVGKSTLLAVLARHLDPCSGAYRHDDTDVLDLPLEQVRARLAIADDEPHAFAGTVRANLLLARPEAADSDLIQALNAADLGHWFSRLPDGLDTHLTGLSGGERTRLSLARGILSARPVLLLDEPTAHLDQATARRVLDRLGQTGRSAVMVSHDLRPEGWQEVALTAPRSQVAQEPGVRV